MIEENNKFPSKIIKPGNNFSSPNTYIMKKLEHMSDNNRAGSKIEVAK